MNSILAIMPALLTLLKLKTKVLCVFVGDVFHRPEIAAEPLFVVRPFLPKDVEDVFSTKPTYVLMEDDKDKGSESVSMGRNV